MRLNRIHLYTSKQAVSVVMICLGIHVLLLYSRKYLGFWLDNPLIVAILFLFLNHILFGFGFWKLTRGPKFTTLFLLTAIALSNLLLLGLALERCGVRLSFTFIPTVYQLISSPLLFVIFIIAKTLKHAEAS